MNPADQVQKALAALRLKMDKALADQRAIMKDGDLTQEAKARRVGEIRRAAVQSIGAEIKLLMTGLKGQHDKQFEKIAELRTQGAKAWDFARLMVEGQELKSRFSAAQTIDDLDAAYRQTINLADSHTKRAAAAAVAEVGAKFRSSGFSMEDRLAANRLIKSVQHDLESLQTTPGIMDAESRAAEVAQAGIQARNGAFAIVRNFAHDDSLSNLTVFGFDYGPITSAAEMVQTTPAEQGMVNVEFKDAGRAQDSQRIFRPQPGGVRINNKQGVAPNREATSAPAPDSVVAE